MAVQRTETFGAPPTGVIPDIDVPRHRVPMRAPDIAQRSPSRSTNAEEESYGRLAGFSLPPDFAGTAGRRAGEMRFFGC
jgi:hypothetical protein